MTKYIRLKTLCRLKWGLQESYTATETQSIPVTIVTHSHACLCVHGVRRGTDAVLLPIELQTEITLYVSGFPWRCCCTVLLHCAARSCLSLCSFVIMTLSVKCMWKVSQVSQSIYSDVTAQAAQIIFSGLLQVAPHVSENITTSTI